MAQDDKILELLDRYEKGKCTPEEIELIHSWYNHQSKIVKHNTSTPDYPFWKEKIASGIPALNSRKKYSFQLKPILVPVVAAMLLAVFTIFYLNKDNSYNDVSVTNLEKNEKILPGTNSATLRLGNGDVIVLDESTQGNLLNSQGISIERNEAGELIYTIAENSSSNEMNVLSTGKGETFKINLSDGTKVWLNASSSLKYAIAMNHDGQRIVELEGEGYFEVAKDIKRTFIVKTKKQKIAVLGTSFNVSAYEDDSKIVTTLVEGSVQLEYDNYKKILVPNEQSILSENGIQTKMVDVTSAIAWKNGVFIFNDEPLYEIMQKLSRWYNIEVEYNDADKDKQYWGGINRYDDISKILNRLEQTGGVRFKVEGRRVIVTK